MAKLFSLVLVVVLVAGGTLAQDTAITPPQLIPGPDLVYPKSERASGKTVTVELLVEVKPSGQAGKIEVTRSHGPAFDDAAVGAIRRSGFVPATRNGKAIAVRIAIPATFVAPGAPLASVAPGTENSVAVDVDETRREMSPHASAENETEAIEQGASDGSFADKKATTVVREKKRTRRRAASDVVLDRSVLGIVPKTSADELLQSVPGLVVSRPEGDAVAGRLFLRGFDAEHGQDIAISVGPIPVNQPSHIHGQGYADLGFVIPEVVRSVRAIEGVYDPQQGDFAVAGSLHLELGVDERGVHTSLSYGSFNTVRGVAVWAPVDEDAQTFGAVAFRKTDGFGDNRGGVSASGIGQLRLRLPGGVKGLLHLALHGARANSAGVLRRDDIRDGTVDFYGSYPDPSANAQSAFSTRGQVALTLERRGASFGRTGVELWGLYSGFRNRQNFTGYLERSRTRPDLVGRGDLIEQENEDLGAGARFYYRPPRLKIFEWLKGDTEIGLSLRGDVVQQAQNLLMAPQNETWDQRVDATIRAGRIGLYVDTQWTITDYVSLRGGGRVDALFFDVDDRLGNFTPAFLAQDHILGFRRNAAGVALGPRATLDVHPLPGLSLLMSYGNGYRSPQPRQLEEGETAPFTYVTSTEVGARYAISEFLEVTTALFATWLSNDLAFDPAQGSLTRIGPTSRRGLSAHLVLKQEWSVLSVSTTFVNATLDAPPPATPENPNPTFEEGQLLPYVPPVVVRADYGLSGDIAQVFGFPLRAKLGAGLSFLAPRPLPYGRFGEPVLVVDAAASIRWAFVEFGLDVKNAFGRRYAANEFSFVSDWGTDDVPSFVPARHIAAASPLNLQATLSLHF